MGEPNVPPNDVDANGPVGGPCEPWGGPCVVCCGGAWSVENRVAEVCETPKE